VELTRVEIREAPDSRERVRLVGDVTYDRGPLRSESFWYEVPRTCAEDLSTSGNAWIASLLPLAVTFDEPLRLHAPVDPRLLASAHELVQLWRCWHPHLAAVTIEADTAATTHTRSARTSLFFSAGLDSFFTLLRPRGDADGTRVDELITVWGFDVPVENSAAGQRLHARCAAVASETGRSFVGVTTNLRLTRWREADWEFLGYGPAMAAVALALESRYDNVLISGGGGYRDLHPSGSHPLIDPLFSTSALNVVHDGAAFTRVEKTRELIKHDVVLRTLRVCWRSRTDENCGACKKCYRAMLMLELLGALNRCTTFPERSLSVRQAARMYCSVPWDFRELRDISALAQHAGRPDIGRAAEQAMRGSRVLSRRLDRLRSLHTRNWQWPARLENRLLQGWIV
jgi:hypothetical protein